MRVLFFIVPLGVIAASSALFRGPPAEVRFSQEVTRGDADKVQLAASQQESRAAGAASFANTTLRSAIAVILSCLAAKLEVVVTEMISCPNPHDQANCGRARAADAKASRVCGEQIQKYTTAALGFNQLNAALGRQLGAQLLDRMRGELDPGVDISREDELADGLPVFPISTLQDACLQATKIANDQPMITAPFPAEVESRVAGFAKSVLQQVASRACGLANVPPARLRSVPKLDEESRRECQALEQRMACQVAYAEGLRDTCPTAGELREATFAMGRGDDEAGSRGGDEITEARQLVLSSDVEKYASCRPMDPGAARAGPEQQPARNGSGRGLRRNRWLCSFDKAKCIDDQIVNRSEAFLAQHLPAAAAFAGPLTGTMGARRSAQRSCTTVTRPVSPVTQQLFGGLRRFASFGRAADSSVLDAPLRSTSCGQWYFRDGPRGSHEGVPVDEQYARPAGWSGFALVRGN